MLSSASIYMKALLRVSLRRRARDCVCDVVLLLLLLLLCLGLSRFTIPLHSDILEMHRDSLSGGKKRPDHNGAGGLLLEAKQDPEKT